METWRTDDLALATYLVVSGNGTIKLELEWDGDIAYGYFVFRMSDSLLDDVEDFISGNARVEPREYSRRFGRMKKSVYKAEGKDRQNRNDDRRRAG